MAQPANNIVDLAAYRVQRAERQGTPPTAGATPATQWVWALVWMPVWPMMAGPAVSPS